MSAPLKALVVDDEPPARARLKELLEAAGDVIVTRECSDGADAADALARDAFDVAFLDVRMPGLSGLEVARAAGARSLPPLVFVTAFGEHAVDAFGVEAVDYLMKPIGPEHVARALARVRSRREPGDVRAKLAAREGGDRVFIEPRDIEWVESARNYVILHHGGAGGAGRESLVRTTLAEISVKLAPLGFARAHRTALVRLDAVRAIESAGSAAVVLLASGARIPVGRRQRARFAALLPR